MNNIISNMNNEDEDIEMLEYSTYWLNIAPIATL